MRNRLAIPLAIGVLATAALPASAGGNSGRAGHHHQGTFRSFSQTFSQGSQGDVLPSFASTNSLAALELHGRLIANGFNSEFARQGLTSRGIGDLGLLDSGWGGWGWGGWSDTYPTPAMPYAPRVIVVRAPRRPVAEERPTVEMTPSGVQIVRGPGSRHVMP
jgi:hypothetical protein